MRPPRSYWFGAALVGASLTIASTGCERAWRNENLLQNQLLNVADHPPARWSDGYAEYYAKLVSACDAADEVALERRVSKLEACFAAGRALFWGGDVRPDPERGTRLLRTACLQSTHVPSGDRLFAACTELGIALLLHPGAEGPKTGHEILWQQCGPSGAQRDWRACEYHALALELGIGTDVDLPRALPIYESLCGVRRIYHAAVTGEPEVEGTTNRSGLACMRVASLAERRVIEEPHEVVAQLYADVCEHDEHVEDFARVACPLAAKIFAASGYAFRDADTLIPFHGSIRLTGPLGGDIPPDPPLGHTAVDLAARGCRYGDRESCDLLKKWLDEAEGRGEIFDLR